MTDGGPSAALDRLCRGAARRIGDRELQGRLRAVSRQLREPLRVAVAGAVSSGKSTLVNALLGRPVAAADAGECTRVVTAYEYGPDDGVADLELLSGEVRTFRLPDGGLPAELPVPAERVRRIRVRLSHPALERLVVIDTPGVNTVTVANERAARRAVFGSDGSDHAQALVYVLRYVQRFDAGMLAEFRDLCRACGMTGVNTLAVLSHVDRRGDGDDPWPAARTLAARAYEQLRTSVFDVVPTIGLLAETGNGRRLGSTHIAALRDLAGLDPYDLDDLLLDLDDFAHRADLPTPADIRRDLVARLHRFGIRLAVDALRDRPGLGADGLHDALVAGSGFGAAPSAAATGTVAAGIAHFAHRSDQLKALAAIGRLRRIAAEPAGDADRAVLAELAAELDENRPVTSGLRGLGAFTALEAVGRDQMILDDVMLDDLLRLARADDPAGQVGLPADAPVSARRAAARDASVRWRAFATSAGGRAAGQHARAVLAVLEDLALEEPDPSPGRAATLAVHRGPGREPPLDPAVVAALLDAPILPAQDATALRALLSGIGPAERLDLPSGAGRDEITDRAGHLSTRFRALLHRPLPPAQRRAVEAVCAAYERIWALAEEVHADDGR
jgi:hypothetical protein